MADYIEQCLTTRKIPAGAFCVLARTARAFALVDAALARRRIAYRVVAGRRFADRQEVRDIAAWVRVLMNPDDDIAIERVLTRPKRGIGPATIEKIRGVREGGKMSWLDATTASCELGIIKGQALAGLQEVRDIALRLVALTDRRCTPNELVSAILRETGIHDKLRREAKDDDAADAATAKARLEHLEMLQDIAHEHTTIAGFADHLAVSDTAQDAPDAESVTVSTVHAAKGLEWSCVIFVGFEKGIIPHTRGEGPEGGSESKPGSAELEEERRIAHVGMTRAMDRLIVTYAKRRRGSESEASPFVSEIRSTVDFYEHQDG